MAICIHSRYTVMPWRELLHLTHGLRSATVSREICALLNQPRERLGYLMQRILRICTFEPMSCATDGF